MDREGRLLDEHEQHRIRFGIIEDSNALATGYEYRGKPLDGTFELQRFLEAEGVGMLPEI